MNIENFMRGEEKFLKDFFLPPYPFENFQTKYIVLVRT